MLPAVTRHKVAFGLALGEFTLNLFAELVKLIFDQLINVSLLIDDLV